MLQGHSSGPHPVSPDGQGVSRVHVPLPIIPRLPVPKDLHLKMPNHGVHNLPVREREREGGRRKERGSETDSERERDLKKSNLITQSCDKLK